MHSTIQNLIEINNKIKKKISEININLYNPKIIAVSKTFSITYISHLIDYGHEDFGENKVQEAFEKWNDIKKKNNKIKLHMIGKLQTNKVKQAVSLFDYIHSLDSEKLALKIAKECEQQKKNIKVFIQINIGKEEQKSGVNEDKIGAFYNFCKNLNLDVIGIMCIPPFNKKSSAYFSKMSEISIKYNFSQISMGMSNDYLDALNYRSTYLRIGSKIFGERN